MRVSVCLDLKVNEKKSSVDKEGENTNSDDEEEEVTTLKDMHKFPDNSWGLFHAWRRNFVFDRIKAVCN